MRQFTDKDIAAASVALMGFIGSLDGKIRKSKTLLPVVEMALYNGLTFDELFNKYNWERAAEKIKGLSPEDYVNLLSANEVICRSIKDEEGWCDDMHTMYLLAKSFHDFYMEICPKGGTWSTDNARINLEKAIKMHSLQALMSETAIAAAIGKKEEEQELTCYNYIAGIIKDWYHVDDALSEEQLTRCSSEEATSCSEEAGHDDEAQEETGLVTETAPNNDDDTIWEQYNACLAMEEHPFMPEEIFVAFMLPREMKKTALQSIIYNYRMDELSELLKMVPKATTLSDFIEQLTDGEIDLSRDSPTTREIHQYINGDLLPTFINCIRMQGYEMTEEMAQKHDPLTESWDFRDERTRKVHKLKQLIYNFGNEDKDLLDCIEDIERFYA